MRKDGSLVRVMDYRSKGLGFESWRDQTLTQTEESRQFSVTLGVGITSCGHIERKDQGNAPYA